jgi:Xaa-Pro aminopeptidase
MDTLTHPHRLRIERLREAMQAIGVHGALVPSSDPHLSEYLPERWAAREWLSGFTGSMGTLVVTLQEAALFADSRYWAQAQAQLQGSGIGLVKIGSGTAATHLEWIASRLQAGQTLAVDGQVLGLGAAAALKTVLDKAGITLRSDVDLLEDVWPERPGLPTDAVYEHAAAFASQSRADKLAAVRAAMQGHGATHHFISTVDDTAWLLNLRGSDVSYNPVFVAHLLLEMDAATLFVADAKVDAALQGRLAADGVRLATYAQAPAALAALPAASSLLIDPRRVTFGLKQHVPEGVRCIEAINPSTLLKSRKNAREAAHIREAMREDGAAMCAFYAAFEASLARGERWSELDVDARLSAERAKRPGYMGLSFSVIAGWAANGALPHYRALPDSFAWIEGDGMLLIDSGGQYLGGTTDITRVWPVGTPSAAMKRDYTLVLKGTMGLSRARFPRGTLSPMLDAIARAPLWAEGIEFGHGTGHGVGYFLNVHEGPQSISKAVPTPEMAMEPGMVTSIEPGVYRDGQWGVRIENLVLSVTAATPEAGSFGEFLEFETLTLCPIDTRLIEPSLLREDEVQWLNAYHATVRERLSPLVDGAALAWLIERTQPLR